MTTPVGWNQVQDAIRACIVSTGGVAANAVAWENEQRPTAKIPITLKLIYADAIQNRDTFTANIPDDGGFKWALSTLYYVRIQVRAESIFNAPGADALFTLEKIRAGLQRPGLTLASGVVTQPDDQTYMHDFPFAFDGRIVSCFTFEMGFRAIIDFPLTGPEAAGPNMVDVEVNTGLVDTGETDPVVIAADVDRP